MNLLNGLKSGKDFFNTTGKLFYYILIFLSVLTTSFFWILVATYYQNYFDLAVLFLQVIRLAIICFLLSIMLGFILDCIYTLIIKKQLKEVTDKFIISKEEAKKLKKRKK